VEKVAVPIAEGVFSAHFGRSAGFAVFEVDRQARTVLGRQDLAAPAHEHGAYPAWLRDHGVSVVLAGGMGPGAQSLFAKHRIQVLTGVSGTSPEALVASYVDGSLVGGVNLCGGDEGHHHEGHHHGDHHCGQ
jgi:predicted Fe-Mo cluster-binding NifX family protein